MAENDSMSTTHLEIAYDGPALREGYMDVNDLAPALLALSALCTQANNILNGDRATVEVVVLSDFKTGSFGIDLQVLQTIAETVKTLLMADPVKTAKDIGELLGLAVTGIGATGGGLLWLIRKIKGRKITAVEKKDGGAKIELRIDGDNNNIVIGGDLYRLFESPVIRNAAREVLRPLEQPGIDEFQIREDNAVVDRVTKPELPEFTVETSVEPEEVLTDYMIPEAAYRIVKPSFEHGLTWKLSDGASKIDAYLKDETFWQEMENGLRSFAIGDVMIVAMKVKSFRSERGTLRTEYIIDKVLDFRHRPKQLNLGEN
ncbi:MAG TPA: hypothetical protein VGQ65_25370 [Thermoanaerobaculia bacterium]|jgi:hypothetical protein|nr:hypothetical protein [Thermoanaerobaculia bacterium]